MFKTCRRRVAPTGTDARRRRRTRAPGACAAAGSPAVAVSPTVVAPHGAATLVGLAAGAPPVAPGSRRPPRRTPPTAGAAARPARAAQGRGGVPTARGGAVRRQAASTWPVPGRRRPRGGRRRPVAACAVPVACIDGCRSSRPRPEHGRDADLALRLRALSGRGSQHDGIRVCRLSGSAPAPGGAGCAAAREGGATAGQDGLRGGACAVRKRQVSGVQGVAGTLQRPPSPSRRLPALAPMRPGRAP